MLPLLLLLLLLLLCPRGSAGFSHPPPTAPTLTPTSAQGTNINHNDPPPPQQQQAPAVTVYDSVLSPVSCQVLHALCLDQSLRLDGETCRYARPPHNATVLTPLELAMESILVQLDEVDAEEVDGDEEEDDKNDDNGPTSPPLSLIHI